MAEETDEQLISSACLGDREAFGKLIERHQKPVAGFLLSLFGDLTLAEDVAQEAFVKAFMNLKTFEGRAGFRTWVSRIAINQARSYQRWARLRSWLPLDAPRRDEEAESWVESFGDQEKEKNRLDRRLELERAMMTLAPREREIAALRLEGYALGEIGEILEISPGTVKSTLFTATRKMKEKLK